MGAERHNILASCLLLCLCLLSCSPNAINYVIGDLMIVRAARDVSAGDEFTISYLGR